MTEFEFVGVIKEAPSMGRWKEHSWAVNNSTVDRLLSDADKRHAAYQSGLPPAPVDPLDIKIDGETLRSLLRRNEEYQRNETQDGPVRDDAFTLAQRLAISFRWSAELRAKVRASEAAAKEREVSVRYCEED